MDKTVLSGKKNKAECQDINILNRITPNKNFFKYDQLPHEMQMQHQS